jgi:hypothetical protein
VTTDGNAASDFERPCPVVDSYNQAQKMARDRGLEEIVHASLAALPGISEKPLFGGWAFLLDGNLLCGCRKDSLMIRVGADNESWALEIQGVVPVVMRGHRIAGYVRAAPEAYGNDRIREQLLEAAANFTRSLPAKAKSPSAQ